ncbi:bifunctional UDP-N-acetylglucosamine diphosphorylase/glucosamine-1-phosphate N-acetyltransferase GlmU [Lautropia mirabilis ATCC 51599]|jgi:UDP-N-acetylglucosamine diphosphorylase/glucosamine-1-phosphate N-acetyltransferase|uniref:Bifunctional protein GlmU n=1 Tax=Lautropia mirabilis ATCC 51599 TaxID=887898 RepID=E7S053_9BURK|nr:bifunctional UDP-N-acetylglucosamine diphosphorylase/glucosamine-1-phosphate N-acetyltransferase GlmU [Lautropia mirabilis]EFV94202.1 UDP-N-acetylglucosamine diphosphorylase/glucosamine-1-phosphate N-acetyltransferase [Lautropia mirabilis ATCC 51599]VEG99646.1 Bifunctional protein GlmU [Lautropia mirabilis]
MNIVILAAGMGKRMNSDLPKVLHPLAGKSLLGHVVDTARTLDPQRLVVVYGHGGEQVQAAFAGQTDVQWALQSPQLGTGHAVAQAVPMLVDDVPTLILYGDVPLVKASTLQRLAEAAQGGKLALLSQHVADPTGYGRVVRDAAGNVSRIVEQKDADAETLKINEVNTGILVCPTGPLKRWLTALKNDNAQGEYYLTDVIAAAVADGTGVVTAHPDAEWETLGVNSKTQLAFLERRHQRNLADRLTDSGVMLADPDRIDIRGTLECGRDVFIDVGCVFEGTVRLGKGVKIGPNCVLKDCTLADGTQVQAMSVIDSAEVGAQGRIGPFARLRPGTKLGEDSHIGNFVELKNASTGTGSKINHLSYVGDAEIGSRVNIGAGTITCNYDGVNKHKTIIEDDVFVGSDSQLVAPVTVRRGATLAAGTTLTREAPADSLTLSRVPQTTKSEWKRPQRKTK